jgi:hypothetical protein
MRCRQCAAELPHASRFCGICGTPVAAAVGERVPGSPPDSGVGAAGPAPAPEVSGSRLELPVSLGARRVRLALVLALDLLLAGAGVAMVASYLDARRAAADRAPADPPPAPAPAAQVDALEPVVAPVGIGAPAAGGAPPRAVSRARSRARSDARSRPVTRAADPAVAASSGPAVADATAPAPAATGDSALERGLLDPADDGGEDAPPFSPAKVRRVVEDHATQLQRCYQRAATSRSLTEPLTGKIEIQFTLAPGGTAREVAPVGNTTGSPELAACVAGLIESWSFPDPGAPVSFVWPFVFRAP